MNVISALDRQHCGESAGENHAWEVLPLPQSSSDRERSHSTNRARSQSETAAPSGQSINVCAFPIGGDSERCDELESGGISGVGISIPIVSTNSNAIARARFDRREFLLQGRLSPDSSDEEDSELQMYSTSYAGPRDLANYTFEMAQMTGYLDKQSVKSPEIWKRRWFVMQQNVLFYYRSEREVRDTKPTDITCCGVIQLDNIDSVTTAKEFGVGAFQIRVPERKYILRAASKECMHDWLFNFQKSIANIVSVLLRSKTDHRSTRLGNSLSRRSFTRVSRSVSFDCQDYVDFGRMSADFPSHHFQSGFVDSASFSDESSSEHTRTSPRRATSPLGFSHYGPRSPVAMFAFDPPFESLGDDIGVSDLYGGVDGPLIEGHEEEERDGDDDATVILSMVTPSQASPMLQRTLSPPVSSGKYIPRFLRDRQKAEAAAPPPVPATSPPRISPPPSSLGWMARLAQEGRAFRTREGDAVYYEDNVSFTTGSESHGVTSLKGVRKNLEDVCCCVPDLSSRLAADSYSRHSLYALFDGHCGVRAASYLNDKLLNYLCEHDAFTSNPRSAFTDCFRRIDEEFLLKATTDLISDGSTAAVVLIRGNQLLTANLGDSRAVVSVNGIALDVIEEQTPGRPDERDRIERLGGWVKEERELQMSKLHSMDLSDPWIQQKAERVVRWVNIYRVNGELAVSRAIGDMDYKGRALMDYEFWAFPEGHDGRFYGDLVICEPEFKEIEITPEVKFLVLACDGLWDTITSQEAVNHVQGKLEEGYSTVQISHSLADLAIRSGSSDNVSVVVVLLQPY